MQQSVETQERPLDLDNLANVWELYNLDEEAFVPCPTARRFLLLLLSASTQGVERTGLGVGFHKAQLLLYGSVTDDYGNLVAEHTLTREEVQALSVREKRALRLALSSMKLKKDPSGIQTRKVLEELGIRAV